MNYKMVAYLLGRILLIVAALMCLPFLIAVIGQEKTWFGFLLAVLGQLALGLACSAKKPKNQEFYAKEGFVIVAMVWVLTSLFGALPFYVSGEIPSYIDALFETISGFTTTGATILNDIEALSKSTLFWRSFTHWIGGMGVLVFVLAVLPKSHASQSIHLMRAEVPGPQVGKLVSRMRGTARILYAIYLVMTLVEVLCLKAAGMPWFDSLLSAFSTAGTGGFSVKNASIAAYDSALIDGIITIFMLLFGVNFTLYYLILTGHVLQALKSEELRWYVGILGAFSLLITLNIMPQYAGFWNAFRYAIFQVGSVITTTGFITADFNKWPVFSKLLLMILLFMGACAGSTGGGFKVSRVLILLKASIRELRQQISPRSVTTLTLEGRPLEDKTAYGVLVYLAIYVFVFICSHLLIALDSESYLTGFTAVATCLNNVGPGLDAVGPVENFSHFSGFSKLVLSVDMLAGRLELLPILTLLSPATWRHR